MATVDVTVMGAGIFGLSVAWACARRGARVLVVDPTDSKRCSSRGLVGALSPHTPERWEPKKQFQFESLIMARQFWQEVDGLSGLGSGYGRVGRLQPISNQHTLDLAVERIGQAAELWKGQALWEVRPEGDFEGWVPPSPTGMVIHDTLSARMDPRRAGASLKRALSRLGVEIVAKATPKGSVVWATGYLGLLEMSQEFGQEVGNGVKGQSVLLRYDRNQAPQIFAEGVHFVPHDNGTLGVGSTSERYFDDVSSTDQLLDDLLNKAQKTMPQLLNAPVLEKWAGVRPRAITRAPMLGDYPGRSGEFVANGGFKIGFGMAPKVAEVMADLVLEKADNIPPEFKVEASLAD